MASEMTAKKTRYTFKIQISTLKLLICLKKKIVNAKNNQAYNSQKLSNYFYWQLNQNTPKTLP